MITVTETFNGSKDFPLAGKYFKLLSSSSPVDISFLKDIGQGGTVNQVTLGFYCKLLFDRIRITTTPGGDTVKFFVSDDEGGYDPFVSVAIAQTLGGAAQNFDKAVDSNNAFAECFTQAGVAAQNSAIVVAAAAGKTFYVDAFRVRSSVAADVVSLIPSAALGSVLGTLQSRKVSGARSQSQMTGGNNVAAGSDIMDAIDLPTANVGSGLIILDRPIQLLGGQNGIAFRSTNVLTALTVAVYGREY